MIYRNTICITGYKCSNTHNNGQEPGKYWFSFKFGFRILIPCSQPQHAATCFFLKLCSNILLHYLSYTYANIKGLEFMVT